MPSTYDMGENNRLIRCWNCRNQIQYSAKEVEVEDPYYSCLTVKTPAGKHTITLKYIPYGMWPSKFISLGFIILSFFICFLNTRKHFHSKRL